MSLALNIGKCTLLGNYRENNEDSIEVKQFPDLVVAIVADGMGGQAAGEIASKRAVEIIPRELKKDLATAVSPEQTREVIRQSTVRANEEIMRMGMLERDYKNMGTTVVMAVWRKGTDMYVTGVGDSRVYLIRGKRIEQLTVDHSLAQALVEAGTISPAEAKGHKFHNVLWKYLGSKEVGDGPDVKIVPIQPGDRFLLCTDGLHGVVSDNELLAHILEYEDVQTCADVLGELALKSGSRDNVSCIVIGVVENR
jgi:serine/threonine protein phosphatase PrpC